MEKLLGQAMPLGCIMVDLESTTLQPHEKERLLDPLVAGVILFSRNYESIEQLQALTTEIHQLRHPKLLIAVDHEGGRVQRFKEGFSMLPAMGQLGKCFRANEKEGLELAQQVGWLMAT
ncbi:MAG: beta-N-acetylhexosaminidase, partial [Hydrogenovibrio crunogenus]|nr:beta-N-acetylhexosaminidase [Hydrogenovibrio crunogenus]